MASYSFNNSSPLSPIWSANLPGVISISGSSEPSFLRSSNDNLYCSGNFFLRCSTNSSSNSEDSLPYLELSSVIFYIYLTLNIIQKNSVHHSFFLIRLQCIYDRNIMNNLNSLSFLSSSALAGGLNFL